jgi:hypothetical protein
MGGRAYCRLLPVQRTNYIASRYFLPAGAELQEALAFLAPRMPGLASDGPAVLGGVEGIYGIESLPLRWS